MLKGKAMSDLLLLTGLFVGWFVVMRWVLPAMGVPT